MVLKLGVVYVYGHMVHLVLFVLPVLEMCAAGGGSTRRILRAACGGRHRTVDAFWPGAAVADSSSWHRSIGGASTGMRFGSGATMWRRGVPPFDEAERAFHGKPNLLASDMCSGIGQTRHCGSYAGTKVAGYNAGMAVHMFWLTGASSQHHDNLFNLHSVQPRFIMMRQCLPPQCQHGAPMEC